MAGAFRNIQVLLTASSGNLRSQLITAARAVDDFGKKAEAGNKKVAASSADSAKVLAGVVATAFAVKKGFDATIGAASEFETRMRNVNSISGLSEGALRSLGGEVLDLSRRLPQSANVLAEGLYEIASSGFQGAEGLKVLEAAAKAASAGLSTTAVSGKAITAVLNAYGLDASAATDVSDALFQTVNVGVVSFEELAGVIGDTLGTAAAASVNYDELGAAIATMTLSGISGAEAATSLNRVLQELIAPSDSLALVLRQLGYESGTQALEADGLQKVMERLRQATGGNVAALLRLFPEIRSARGALALMSKEGQNYARVAAQIEDAEARRGATQRALNEQMKALGAQWTLFRNRAQAAAIELGTRLIPAVLDTLNGIQSLAKSALPSLQHGLTALAPFFRNVRDIGADLVDVAKSLIANLSPLGKVLAGIVAGTVITSLNSLATVLGSITGFLADHPALVTALAIAYGAKLALGVAQAAKSFALLALDRAALALYDAAGGVDRAAASFAQLRAAMTGIGFAVAVAGFAAVAQGSANAKRQASALVDELTRDVDTKTVETVRDAYRRLSGELETQTGILRQYGGAGGNLKGTLELLTPLANKGHDASEAVKALREELNATGRQLQNHEYNLRTVARETGVSTSAVEALAAKLGVDLTAGFADSTDEREALIAHIGEIGAKAGVSTDKLADATEDQIAQWEAVGKAVDEIAKKVEDVFLSSSDFIAAFRDDAAESSSAAVETARDQLADAQSALADLQSRSGEKTRQDVSDQQALRKARERVSEARMKSAEDEADALQALADLEERQAAGSRTAANDQRAIEKARRRVADATDAVREAEAKVVTQGGQIRSFYAEQIALTSQFATDLTTAAEKGLDPEVLKRLLTAGPEKAGPILQAILSDHSGGMIRMVNESEQKLREINTKVVEFARLTQRAVSSNTDTMARDLGTAMKIAAANMEQGAKATVEGIAKAIGVPSEEVRRVAREFGITIATDLVTSYESGVTTGLDAATLRIKEQFDRLRTDVQAQGPSLFGPVGAAPPMAVGAQPTTSSATTRSGRVLYRHGGGPVSGPSGSDVPAVLQTGEFVLRRSAAQALGAETLNALNRYHQDGHVGRAMPSVAVPSQSTAIDYDRLAAAVARTGTTAVNAPMSVTIQGGGRPTRADLEYANRQQAWMLAGVVTR